MSTDERHRVLFRHVAPHREWLRRYRHAAAQQHFRLSVLLSIILFFAGEGINYLATIYAGERISNSVTDIVLSNTPVYDVDGFFIYGALALVIFIVGLLVAHPKRIPFVLYTLALLLFIRAGFIALTHIAPFPQHTPINFTSSFGIFLSKLWFGDDLFFSNHTAFPFMMALVHWRDWWLRYIFLAWSVFFAVIVLLGHLHYSIDVASAFFITYGIFHIACWLFPKERELFHSEMLVE